MRILALFLTLAAAACSDISHVGERPDFTPVTTTREYAAMMSGPRHDRGPAQGKTASLWHAGPTSLLGDRRASALGDLMTVVIRIDDKAEFSNSSKRSRTGSESLSAPQFFGVPQVVDENLPDGASSDNAVDLSSSSSASGDGSIRRNEKLTLRVAVTVTEVLANGHLRIEGTQEVRVNYELRELLVTGYVRPQDISRQNEITYDKIASARISYGGRGQVSTVQQPRTGQQVIDLVMPF